MPAVGYHTRFGSLDAYEKGGVKIIDDDVHKIQKGDAPEVPVKF
jgi:hypothetical protein